MSNNYENYKTIDSHLLSAVVLFQARIEHPDIWNTMRPITGYIKTCCIYVTYVVLEGSKRMVLIIRTQEGRIISGRKKNQGSE